ncbi:substrate import-associated zinc metallohydrolase lipoprotein [Sphingobacterium lactis]|uniref:substrate import-associated zinc metallohydrolase lipoprotein n=1 Tax=Sphingobacterium lactis TaxID=797291 RepID=UPI003F817011
MKANIIKTDIIRILIALLLCPLVFSYTSCNKDAALPNDPIDNLGGYKPEGNPEIDAWIKSNLTQPFNIAVKYQYDPFEIDYMKVTTPPKEDYVIPTMRLVLSCMANPYLKNSDSTFVKKIIPKLWVLVGSAQYNNDGTMVLGQAEGANKITIMDVNKYAPNEQFAINTNYTVHHETAHILHQTKLYSQQFKFVNPEYYTATWHNYSDKEAFDLGFVRNYAMASSDEDFVETIAFLLVKGQQAYNDIISNSSAAGKERLRIKEQLVVEYFKDKWSIDFRQLQTDVRAGISSYINENN